MAADGEWIDASVGLLLTLHHLDDWAIENGDEDIDGEDLQEECESYWTKADELATVIRNSTAPDPNKSAFFRELMDWIAGICEEDDWSRWREPLRSCLFLPAHYERLREHIEQLEPALLASGSVEKPVNTELLHWWVQASLDSGREPEAEQAEARLTAFDTETSACFVHYYERLDRTDEAVARLQYIIEFMQEQVQRKSSEPLGMRSYHGYRQQANHYFEWLVTILEQAGRQTEAKAWYVQWFETVPSLELFKLCLEAISAKERECQAQKWIAHVHLLGTYEDLLIDMHLHLDDPDGAWSVYQEENHETSDWLSDSAQRLFEVIKQHDPKRLVPILRQFAEKRISAKNRTSYQQAAEWLTELKSVYHLLDQTEAWTLYLRDVRENYRRLPALQDEITKAKL